MPLSYSLCASGPCSHANGLPNRAWITIWFYCEAEPCWVACHGAARRPADISRIARCSHADGALGMPAAGVSTQGSRALQWTLLRRRGDREGPDAASASHAALLARTSLGCHCSAALLMGLKWPCTLATSLSSRMSSCGRSWGSRAGTGLPRPHLYPDAALCQPAIPACLWVIIVTE